MTLRNINTRFPRIRAAGKGRVEMKLGKLTWAEDVDAPMLDIGSREDAVKLFARLWCIKNGIRTWRQLLNDPVKLAEYHARNENMKVDD